MTKRGNMDINLSRYLEAAKNVALEAGCLVESRLGIPHDIQSKSSFDFVTETDALSESLIRNRLIQQFPDHLFFGEEQVSQCSEGEEYLIQSIPLDRYVWVVDPIDGTTNFIRGIPQFAISIALVRGWEVMVGVIYDVSLHSLYWTAKGLPSYCGEEVIHVSNVSRLEQAIIATSFPASDLEKRELVLRFLEEEGKNLLSLRIWNCATLAAAQVAAGHVDLYFEPGIHLWDFSAGMLLIQNAGGCFSDLQGNSYHKLQRHVFAAGPVLYQEVGPKLKQIFCD